MILKTDFLAPGFPLSSSVGAASILQPRQRTHVVIEMELRYQGEHLFLQGSLGLYRGLRHQFGEELARTEGAKEKQNRDVQLDGGIGGGTGKKRRRERKQG